MAPHESVLAVKLYTRTGDRGQTGLFGGSRVPKDDVRVEACGMLDEANAHLGLARAQTPPGSVDAIVERIQHELLTAGAELACNPGCETRLRVTLISGEHTTRIEREIDSMNAELPPLNHFLLPGGDPAAAALHVARATLRTAERRTAALHRVSPVRHEVMAYLNRLADLLFVLARACNHARGAPETHWRPDP